MNHPFDELTKSLTQSVTRRAALKQFDIGLAGMELACFGLADNLRAQTLATSTDKISRVLKATGSTDERKIMRPKRAAPICDLQSARACMKQPV